jgi:predicted TIM-barrel fold metal-dependent hydrolase
LAFQGLQVIDFHVHLPVPYRAGVRPSGLAQSRPRPSPDARSVYAAERRAAWRREWGFPDPEDVSAVPEEELAARWAAEAVRHDLRRVVLVSGGDNATLARLIAPHRDRLLGFCHHDLAAPDALNQLKRGVEELGLLGYKMIAPLLSIRLDDPSLEPLWTYVEQRRLPVLIHFGWLGTGGGIVHHPMISPLSLFPVAHAHPDIPFVIAHFGCGYWGDLLQLCWSCPNVYVETSGSNQWVRWMPYNLTLEDLFRKAYETVGPNRIIFGTDSSWFPRGFAFRYLEEQVRVCRWLAMREDELALIFGGNAARLLGLPPDSS